MAKYWNFRIYVFKFTHSRFQFAHLFKNITNFTDLDQEITLPMGHCSKFPLPPVEDTIIGGENTIGNPAYHNKCYRKSEPKFINCFLENP